jgi:hypothetical protein
MFCSVIQGDGSTGNIQDQDSALPPPLPPLPNITSPCANAIRGGNDDDEMVLTTPMNTNALVTDVKVTQDESSNERSSNSNTAIKQGRMTDEASADGPTFPFDLNRAYTGGMITGFFRGMFRNFTNSQPTQQDVVRLDDENEYYNNNTQVDHPDDSNSSNHDGTAELEDDENATHTNMHVDHPDDSNSNDNDLIHVHNTGDNTEATEVNNNFIEGGNVGGGHTDTDVNVNDTINDNDAEIDANGIINLIAELDTGSNTNNTLRINRIYDRAYSAVKTISDILCQEEEITKLQLDESIVPALVDLKVAFVKKVLSDDDMPYFRYDLSQVIENISDSSDLVDIVVTEVVRRDVVDRKSKLESTLTRKAAIILQKNQFDENTTTPTRGDTDAQLIISRPPTETYRGDVMKGMKDKAFWYIRYKPGGEYMKAGGSRNVGQRIKSLATHEPTNGYVTQFVETTSKVPLFTIERYVLFYAYALEQKAQREHVKYSEENI